MARCPCRLDRGTVGESLPRRASQGERAIRDVRGEPNQWEDPASTR